MKINWNNIPETIGVYLWKGKDNQVIYIGKSKNIKKSMMSYFTQDQNPLFENIFSYEYFETNNEEKAIKLENDLILEYEPKFNWKVNSFIMYPYIEIKYNKKITLKVTNHPKLARNKFFFGPISCYSIARKTIFLLTDIYNIEKINSCTDLEKEDLLKKITKIFSGDISNIKTKIKARIKNSLLINDNNDVEICINYLKFIEIFNESSKKILNDSKSKDIFNYYRKNGIVSLSVSHIRYGYLKSTSNYIKKQLNPLIEDVFDGFINSYYSEKIIPDEIILPHKPIWIKKNKIVFDEEKNKDLKKIMEYTENHAKKNFYSNVDEFFYKTKTYQKGLKFLKNMFNKEKINIIEMIDIYDISESQKIIIFAKFINGIPDKDNYKKDIITFNTKENLNLLIKKSLQNHFLNMDNKILSNIFIIANKIFLIDNIFEQKFFKELSICIAYNLKNSDGKLIDLRNKEFNFKNNSQIYFLLQDMQYEMKNFFHKFHIDKDTKYIHEIELDKFYWLSEYDKQNLFKKFKTFDKIISSNEEELCKIISINKTKKILRNKNE